jgi:Protein of unknown function (DUF2817)
MKHLYRNCREEFLKAAEKLKEPNSLIRYTSPYMDPERKKLTTEYLKIWKESAKKWVIISSGTVGTDLYIGSEIQTELIKMIDLGEIVIPECAGLLFIHGINAWGAAWVRPGNINNVMLDMNFNDNISELIKLEKENAHLRKLDEIYKSAKFFINPIGHRSSLSYAFSAGKLYFKHGRQNVSESIFTCQRHYLVGLSYGGTEKQLENIELENYVRSLIPKDATKIIHLDIQTKIKSKDLYTISTEDGKSTEVFKNLCDIKITQSINRGLPSTSIISGLRDEEADWYSGVFGIGTTSLMNKFKSYRNENITHCENIWIENWTRDELSYLNTLEYFSHSSKKKLFESCYLSNKLEKKLVAEKARNLIRNVLEYLDTK